MSDPVTEHRLSAVERAVVKISEAVERIAENTAQIANLEVRHAETRDGLERAFDEIGKIQGESKALDSRVQVIEQSMPGLTETRTNINRVIWGLAGMVGLALVGLVLVK